MKLPYGNFQCCLVFCMITCTCLVSVSLWGLLFAMDDEAATTSIRHLRSNHYVKRFRHELQDFMHADVKSPNFNIDVDHGKGDDDTVKTLDDEKGEGEEEEEEEENKKSEESGKVTKNLPHIAYNVTTRDMSHYTRQLDARYKASTAMSVKFKSLHPKRVDLFWDDHRGGVNEGHLSLGQTTTTTAYLGHEFFVKIHGHDEEISRFRLTGKQAVFFITDPNYPPPKDVQELADREQTFMHDYYNKTGLHYRSLYNEDGPRPKPRLYMHPTHYQGEVHSVISTEGYWHCVGNKNICQHTDQVPLELEVVSTTPKAFVIKNFISLFEADAIVQLAHDHIKKSQVGDRSSGVKTSDTRTSLNAWLTYRKSSVIESIYSA